MQKLILSCLLFLCLGFTQNSYAKDGYRIQVKLEGMKDSMAYLVNYYGKPLPTIYKTDSARFDKNGVANFKSDTTLIGGIYIILLTDKKTYIEFLLNNGDDLGITMNTNDLPLGLKFRNSPENERFIEYMRFLQGYGKKQEAFQAEIAKAKTPADTAAVREKYKSTSKELTNYRRDYIAKYPNTLLSSIFNAIEEPEVPENKKLQADGKTVDSMFAYNYFKDHYWDKFNFNDDRLIHTPLYDAKIDEYMTKLVLPYEDSVIKEADMLLKKAKNSPNLFRYTLWYLTRFVEQSKVMGMDAVFVYLVENYYMKGDAWWLTPDELEKYIKRAHDIAPNVIGNVAPELNLPDINGKMQSLHGLKAKYTLLVFWSPDCGHCLTEVPKIDSMYRSSLKARGVKIYAVRTDALEKWKEVIDKEKLNDWIHVHDPEHTSKFRQDYDIYSTPVIYLLDEKKIIRGKRLDHTNIIQLMDMLDKKKDTTKS